MNALTPQQAIKLLAAGHWSALSATTAKKLIVDYGMTLQTRAGLYRLPRRTELLDATMIREHLSAGRQSCIDAVTVHTVIDSTNTYLRNLAPPEVGRTQVCLAEFQQAGRGRRGKTWIGGFGDALCLSLSWRFRSDAARLGGLSLATGVAVVHALQRLGVQGVQLKWPNDLVRDGRKLGGILVEAQNLGEFDTAVVIGIGLNLHVDDKTATQITDAGGLAPTGLADIKTELAAERNRVAGAIVDSTIQMCGEYDVRGFECSRESWMALSVLAGEQVVAQTHQETLQGVVVGIDAAGALLLRCGSDTRRLVSAEVSVRRPA